MSILVDLELQVGLVGTVDQGLRTRLERSPLSRDDPNVQWKEDSSGRWAIHARFPEGKDKARPVTISFITDTDGGEHRYRENLGFAGIRIWQVGTLEPTSWVLASGARLSGTFDISVFAEDAVLGVTTVSRLTLLDHFVFDDDFMFRIALFDARTQTLVTHDPKIYNRGVIDRCDPVRPLSPY